MSKQTFVLVTDGGDQDNLTNVSTARALALAGRSPVVTTSRERSLAARSKYCADSIETPAVGSAEYPAAVSDILRQGEFLTMLASSDAAIVALGLPGKDLVDKREVSRRAAAVGLPTLPERHFTDGAEMLSCAEELDYPVLVKCAVKRTIVPFHAVRAERPADLAYLAKLAVPLTVQPFISDWMRNVNGIFWNGQLRAVMHQVRLRGWPRTGGVDAASITVEPDIEMERQLECILTGHEGIFQAQFVGPYLIDINPRVYASLMLAVVAGLNLPDMVCQLAESQGDAFDGAQPQRARVGIPYRWIEGDILHVIDGLRQRQLTVSDAVRTLRPVRGTAHRDIPISDTRAFIAHGNHRLQRLRTRSSRRRNIAAPLKPSRL